MNTVKAIILPDTTEGGILQAEWENGEWVITVDANTNGSQVVDLEKYDGWLANEADEKPRRHYGAFWVARRDGEDQ